MSKALLAVSLKILVNIIMQQLVIVQSIIVERNLHSYYRLPIAAVRRSNTSEEYFVLQCPFKSSLNIPKPEDMEICEIIGKYQNHREQEQTPARKTLSEEKYGSRVKAEHRLLKPPKEVKWIKIKKRNPQKVYLKPYKRKDYYKRPKTEIKEQYKATNVRVFLNSPKSLAPEKFNLNRELEDSLPFSSSLKPKIVKQPEQHLEHNDSKEKSNDSETKSEHHQQVSNSPLKYLGTKDALNKLQKQRHSQTFSGAPEKSEKFFVESNKYKKGFKTKGYQNMYHRDEIYQDHIFYDDLEQKGKYDVYKKSKILF
uniref:Uncharacterized protein n=2 Tax=Stomoxys calcitrans TaxID=35570 RepID=A0A1I8QE62_STOCA|nr:unnamed protein product [Stomoxys calcitrans]